jgi:hypothetical protein
MRILLVKLHSLREYSIVVILFKNLLTISR